MLYRAKRKDNKEWIEGYPYRLSETSGLFIMMKEKQGDSYEVVLETLCRSTGRKDISGKEIYQGDIIVSHQNGQVIDLDMVIRYGTYTAYCPADKDWMDSVGFYVSADGYPDMPVGPLEYYAEIIGNIFDNPALIANPAEE